MMVVAAWRLEDGETFEKPDKTATRDIIANPHGTKRRKIMDFPLHFIHNSLKTPQLRVKYVPAPVQKADMFTKSMPLVLLKPHRE